MFELKFRWLIFCRIYLTVVLYLSFLMDIWLVLHRKLGFYLSYSQNNSKTYFSELVTSTYPTQYIHVGDTVSLVCDLKVKTEDELESMKWFIGSDEVDDSNLLDNANFDTTNTLQKTTYTDPVPDKTEGGVYKCQYNFKVGDPISLETTVAVHCEYFFPAFVVNILILLLHSFVKISICSFIF